MTDGPLNASPGLASSFLDARDDGVKLRGDFG
jgi:hypothetical protein